MFFNLALDFWGVRGYISSMLTLCRRSSNSHHGFAGGFGRVSYRGRGRERETLKAPEPLPRFYNKGE